MAKSVVIVESPAKARTIAAFLGNDYVVESSIGHIRDLPRNASDVPAAHKKTSWARLGVDVENDFRPLYVLDANKKPHIAKLKKLIKESDQLLLATDEDREGESIAWHLLEVLEPKVPVKRMVFHEITKSAIKDAISHPRELDRQLVEAQEARRILDRLYGYEVSPVLWKKVMPKLSAGRVQSVATRILVERERERMSFRAASYWDLDGVFGASGGPFSATSVTVDGARVASGKDFSSDGELGKKLDVERVTVLDETAARALAGELVGASAIVSSVVQKPYRRSPSAPFMTSTLQQEAGRKLRYSASRTMRAAQRLYENGYISYMRTDSTTLSTAAISAAREQIRSMYGAAYLPAEPRVYKKKVKNAQEAHEAIRPAGDRFRTPEEVARELGPDEARIYELVWKRTLASQMEDATGQRVQLKVAATTSGGREVVFATSGNTITFPGFLRAYVEGSDDPELELEAHEKQLPEVREGETLRLESAEARGHETQAPPRYTEASLVRHLEELGVGRPSTYASIINTIVDRGYVWKKGTALVPTFKGIAVVRLLEKHFTELVDYAFTARMEDDLDEIANGSMQSVPWLKKFYYGSAGDLGLHAMVTQKLEDIDAREINTLPLGSDAEGREVAVRVGRFGPYLQRGDETANVPEGIAPDELNLARAQELLAAPSGDRLLGVDPATGLEVVAKTGRFGAYVQLGHAEDGGEKPKTQSLLPNMKLEELDLDTAMRLLSLPRKVGVDPGGVEVTAQHGRYGAYIARGEDHRSLESAEAVFTVTIGEALALLAQPRTLRRRAAVGPLRELGLDPVSGKVIALRSGRFGNYVTDGDTNATLRTGDTVEGLTPERAQELLQLRRDIAGSGAKPAGRAKGARGKPKPQAAAGAAKKRKPASGATKKAAATTKPKKSSAAAVPVNAKALAGARGVGPHAEPLRAEQASQRGATESQPSQE